MPAVDLSDIRAAQDREAERQEAIDEVRREQRAKEVVAQARAWDRAMNRAFKGIMPRNIRHAMLQRAQVSDD